MNELAILQKAEDYAYSAYREQPENERLGFAWLEAVNARLAQERA